MGSIFLRIVVASLIISVITIALYSVIQYLPSDYALAYNLYVLIIILGISVFLAGSITDPLERLRVGFDHLLNGKFVQVNINTGDEFEDVANFFNKVAKELIERERVLRETERKYRNLIENLNDWVFETDENLNITFTNAKAYDIFGEVKIIGTNLKELVSETPDPNGKSLSFEARIADRIFEFNLNPLHENGRFVGYIGIGRDITDKKKAEERMAHLAAITEHTIDAIVSLDVDGNIVSWNRGAEAMFGYTAEEMIGKPFTVLMPEDMRELCRENFRKAVIEGYARDIESIRLTKDGRRIVVDQTLTAIYNSNGELTGFVAIMRDITEKKKSEEKLRKAYEELERKTSELRYLANIVENSQDAIYSIDLNGKITSWNKGAEKLFGWKKHEAIGMDSKELLPEGLRSETEHILQKIRSNLQSISFDGKRRCKDGRIIDVEVTVSPIIENGRLSGISVIARDATHKVRSEMEMIRRMLKYRVDIGRLYLTDSMDVALEVLADMTKMGFKGTIITRKLPEDVGVTNCRVLWLSERKSKDSIPPDVDVIEDVLSNLPEKNNVVILELDYLITKVDFDSLLSLIQRLREDFYILRRGVLILVAKPDVFDGRRYSLLRIECEPLQRKEVKLQPELYELLRFVYMKNRVGEKPSIKDTMDELGLSRNTVKKRVKLLKSKGLINLVKYGRSKVLEITEEGKAIFE